LEGSAGRKTLKLFFRQRLSPTILSLSAFAPLPVPLKKFLKNSNDFPPLARG
jgi:hypothetical protein